MPEHHLPSQDPALLTAAAADGLGPVIDLIGLDRACTLMRAFRGRRLYVPLSIGQDHPISRAVGWESAKRLAYYYGGEHLRLPLGRAVAKLIRDREILAMHRGGKSCGQIAGAFQIGERSVRAILQAHRVGRPASRAAPRRHPIPPSPVPGFNEHQITLIARRFGLSRSDTVRRLIHQEPSPCPSPIPAV